MYYFPFCDYGAAIAIDPTTSPVRPRANEKAQRPADGP